ncbi:DUF1330 domain-containing protein [Pararhodonellum marinum]|uniref:DUF1330 domain-containing protein n=1 Tax=Pararhodonellum marinum TaxID=2755358 RepID=UPI00188E6019|nr:DUF1330 domain-containing protein [Pararhodonellum marinum]
MPAFVLVEIIIKDPDAYEGYKKLTPTSIAAYDGKFVVRGGPTVTLEGQWEPERMVLLEFPDVEKAEAWWYSDAYAEAKAIRQKAAETKMIILQGVE